MTGQVTVNLHFCAEIPVTEVADSWQNMKSEIEIFFLFRDGKLWGRCHKQNLEQHS